MFYSKHKFGQICHKSKISSDLLGNLDTRQFEGAKYKSDIIILILYIWNINLSKLVPSFLKFTSIRTRDNLKMVNGRHDKRNFKLNSRKYLPSIQLLFICEINLLSVKSINQYFKFTDLALNIKSHLTIPIINNPLKKIEDLTSKWWPVCKISFKF